MKSVKWFDEKYSSGQQPTLEDRLALCKELDIPLTDRAARKIKEQLKECLYDFNREYSQSLQIITYQLLSILPLIGIDAREQREYIKQYQRAVERHGNKVVFKNNFTAKEDELG